MIPATRFRLLRILLWRSLPVLLLLAVADFIAFRRGWVSRDPRLFAGLVMAVCVVMGLLLADTVVSLIRRRLSRLRATGQILLLGGLLAAGLTGTLNWAFSLQGVMVLIEGERLPLFDGRHLQEFDAGLLADPLEMGVTLELVEVELKALDGGQYTPHLRLLVSREDEEVDAMELLSHGSAASGVLRFHGGAFGFAPHIILQKNGETFFDQVVPFLSRREGAAGLGFDGLFTVASEALEVRGAVLLESLDAGLRGHPTLGLTVRRDGQVLGAGKLRPGEFAELEGGYRVGFSGLKKWAEIDISRRNYPGPILWGGAVALAGAVVWIAALFVRP